MVHVHACMHALTCACAICTTFYNATHPRREGTQGLRITQSLCPIKRVIHPQECQTLRLDLLVIALAPFGTLGYRSPKASPEPCPRAHIKKQDAAPRTFHTLEQAPISQQQPQKKGTDLKPCGAQRELLASRTTPAKLPATTGVQLVISFHLTLGIHDDRPSYPHTPYLSPTTP